jgi:branched-chain amino acid transport system ATP-binding protein
MFSALDDVSIEVGAGQIVGIVGANGAGKSTLLNAISGLSKATSGMLTFEDMDLTKMSAHAVVRAGVVQVPEGRRLFPEMTVYENLLVGSSHKRAKAERSENFDKVFALFPRLKERESQIARTLSGGEQQMVAVARALMSSPRILIMDEPSLGLAPIVIQEIFKVVRQLRELGLTILLVEQNVHHCLQISDYAYVLETGQLVLEGTGKDVLENPLTKAAYLGMGAQEESASD